MVKEMSGRLFSGFANVWTAVERAKAVGRRPRSIVVAGERVVLFRGAGGRIAALMDRCPHRGVALSLGQVHADGTIACPFHGWRFDATGACVHVPLNPNARCDRLGAQALATHEAGGLVWIYTAPGVTPSAPPVLDESLTSDRYVRTAFVTRWRTHWTRAMENMLDMPHLPFVHRTTIGVGLVGQMRPDSEMTVAWEPTETGGRIQAALDGQRDDGWLEFTRPNRMTLHIPIPGRHLTMHVACVPAGPNETRMILMSSRNFARWLPIGPLLNWFNGRVALQDQAIVESSSPAEVPPAVEERSVASDKPTLAFRKYYLDVLRESAAGSGVVVPLSRALSPAAAVPALEG